MYLISEETYQCRGSPKKVTIYPVKRGFVKLKGYHFLVLINIRLVQKS
jgi:hypothetical protein